MPRSAAALTVLPNAERLTFMVKRDGKPVIDPSSIVMVLDGFDPSSGVALDRLERCEH